MIHRFHSQLKAAESSLRQKLIFFVLIFYFHFFYFPIYLESYSFDYPQ